MRKTSNTILITGAMGMLGKAFAQQLGSRAVALTHAECDITDSAMLSTLIAQHHPSAIINCAALTNVDQCEQDPARCMTINTTAVAEMAGLCKKNQCTLIHFSTDYVFDGSGIAPFTETHPRHPINVYGRSKAESEMAVESTFDNYIIARVQWIFGDGRRNFISDIASALKEGREVKAFEDQWGAPGHSTDIARALIQLWEGGHRGIFHVTSSGHANRVEIAKEIARIVKAPQPQIIPVRMQDLQLPATRPQNSRLSIDKLQQLGIEMPSWQDAIFRYLHS